MKQICRQLGVDGVISGTVVTKNLLSDKAFVALNAAALGLAAASALFGDEIWLGGGEGQPIPAYSPLTYMKGKKMNCDGNVKRCYHVDLAVLSIP